MALTCASKLLGEMVIGGTKCSKIFFHVKSHPDFNVDPFLAHVQSKSITACDAGSGDEQTAGFKGKHEDKQRINYKKEGDGLLTYTLCEIGYTYAFYLWYMQPPRHYIQQCCSAVLLFCCSAFHT